MNADTIKALFTYLTAFVLVIGGIGVLYLTSRDANATNLQVIIAGFVGSALTFLFVQENSTRASRSAERQMSIGVSAGTPTTVQNAENVEGGNPTIVQKAD
jgi:zinc transporter ZupT